MFKIGLYDFTVVMVLSISEPNTVSTGPDERLVMNKAACREGDDGITFMTKKVAPNVLISYKGWCSKILGVCIP